MSGDGSISASCPRTGTVDPGTIITMSALIFLRLRRFSPRQSRASLVPRNSAEPLPQPPKSTANTAAAVDASQMKFSSPSRETVWPFVFIILTRLFKELLSSSASVCHSLPGAAPPRRPPPPQPSSLLRSSFPHSFGAHPERGAAMCFSHSSLPRKTSGGVGGLDGRHFLT